MKLLCFLLTAGLMVTPLASLQAAAINLAQLQQATRKVSDERSPTVLALVSPNGSSGSAVVVDAKLGLALTAAHVVQGSERMQAIRADGKRFDCEVLGANYTRDAAMVRVVDPVGLQQAPLAGNAMLKVGDFVVALGHAKGFDPNRPAPLRFGRVVADSKQRFIMSETTLIGGDSGGPLFNLQGELVGIHSSIGPNLVINNHVPLAVFKEDWQRLLSGQQWGQLGLHPMADPNAAVLGFSMGQIDGVQGVVVDAIVPGSPAQQAGLQRGDVITTVAGRLTRSPREFIRELERYKPDEVIEMVVVRAGQAYNTKARLAKRSSFRIIPER